VLARQDYEPFGRQLLVAHTMPREGFGAQEDDAESGQAHFHARQYQSRLGRFARPDPIVGGLVSPQRWNRYAYARNNPLNRTDYSGLDDCYNSDGIPIACPPPDLPPGSGDPGKPPTDGCGVPSARACDPPTDPDPPATPPDDDGDDDDAPEGCSSLLAASCAPQPGPPPPGPPGPPNCTPTGILKIVPDFIRFSFSAGAGLGLTIQLAVDRYGNGYVSVGPSVGRGIPVSVSAAAGYVFSGPRTQENTVTTLSGWSWSSAAGAGPGLGASTTVPFGGHSNTLEPGAYTPQAGTGPSYTWVSRSGSTCK
jgi:RHS repeat-associated protein